MSRYSMLYSVDSAGEAIENRFSFDIVVEQAPAYNVKNVKGEPVIYDGEIKVKCPCCQGGKSFYSMAVCDDCFDKFDNTKHLESILKRKREMVGN